MNPDSSNQRLRGSLVFLVAALIAAAALAAVYDMTRERIADNIIAEQLRSLTEVLPADSYDNELHTDVITAVDDELLGNAAPKAIYRARKNGEPAAAIITTVAPNGYSGSITLIVGINAAGIVTGVRVTDHKETPGLGDKIEIRKTDWITRFNGLSGNDPLATRWTLTRDGGDLDQISGATVTSRAVLNAVRDAVIYFGTNQETIFTAPAAAEEFDDA